MKMMKLTYLLAFALAITLADTGCRNHRPVKVTQIPGSPTGNPNDQTDLNTKAYNSNEPIVTANRDIFDNMDADRAALASSTVHFAYDSAVVRKSEKANVQSVADALGRDKPIGIENDFAHQLYPLRLTNQDRRCGILAASARMSRIRARTGSSPCEVSTTKSARLRFSDRAIAAPGWRRAFRWSCCRAPGFARVEFPATS